MNINEKEEIICNLIIERTNFIIASKNFNADGCFQIFLKNESCDFEIQIGILKDYDNDFLLFHSIHFEHIDNFNLKMKFDRKIKLKNMNEFIPINNINDCIELIDKLNKLLTIIGYPETIIIW